MIKFIHKNHIQKDAKTKSLVIYYNISDIILGFLLIVLVAFFIYNYLEFSFNLKDSYSTGSYVLSNNPGFKPQQKTHK